MAHQKRNFDATRDMWEQRSAGADVVPSPHKRFASPKNKINSRERRSVEPENYDRQTERPEIEESVSEEHGIKDHTAHLKEAFFDTDPDPEDNAETTKYFTPVMTYETQTVVTRTVTVEEYTNSKSAITSDDESDEDFQARPVSPQRPRSHGAVSLNKDDENWKESSLSNGGSHEQHRRSNGSLEKSPSAFSLAGLFKSADKLKALFSTESSPTEKAASEGSSLRGSLYRPNENITGRNHDKTVDSTPLSANHTTRLTSDENSEQPFPLPALVFEEKAFSPKDAFNGPDRSTSIQELEKEAEKQLNLYTRIRERIQTTPSLSSTLMILPRADAERELLLSARKRKGCLNRIEKIRATDSEGRHGGPSNSMLGRGRVSCKNMTLSINSEFWDGLRQDRNADFFVIVVFSYFDQVRATECLQLDEVASDGSLTITDFFQFHNLTSDFSIEVEAQLIRIMKAEAGEDSKKHTPSLLKKFMAVIPKSAGKSGSSSQSACDSSMTSAMSLGSTRLTLHNVHDKTFPLDGGLIVENYDVLLDIKANLELDFVADHQGFLTFHCYTDVGTDWVRRWCKLDGTALSFWKYPDDAERKLKSLGAFALGKCTDTFLMRAKGGLNRPNSFVLHSRTPIFSKTGNQSAEEDFEYSVMADTKEDLEGWLNILNAVLQGMNDWRNRS
ncbi:hypothetical protein RvY_07670 [Ramazzottius varieornatus]|uniref:PH domain-containing protein n=1 Tax=Ramazzottius varieornatus TaxID=947166 RepID=A0A1D1V928_RAMVA|nr:hypothetical protein RvY_07670 [Ramazzottius varieornatus]